MKGLLGLYFVLSFYMCINLLSQINEDVTKILNICCRFVRQNVISKWFCYKNTECAVILYMWQGRK